MWKLIFIFLFCFAGLHLIAQPVTKIEGFAEAYVGKEVKVYLIDDYLSQLRTQIASTTVEADSTFKVSFFNTETRKLRIEVDNNFFHFYAQPKGNYNIYVSESSPYLDDKANRVEVEFFFLGLDSTDINYKILMFEEYQLNFLKKFYHHKSLKSTNFVAELDTFKTEATNKYEADTSQFFKSYVKYSVASLDNLAFLGQRNEYEKYDFYIKPETVLYQNDRYMEYVLQYYKLYEAQLSNEVNELFYKGIINSSPTLLINALGGDYALKNVRLRELIMINMLSEVFYTDVYPQTNILTILDSVSNNAIFEDHKKIASNIKYRLLDLVAGTKMPEYSLMINGTRKFGSDYQGKHVYLQFISKDIKKSIQDLELLQPIQQKYAKHVHFVTILVTEEKDELLKDASSFIKENKIAWDFSVISKNNPILKKLNVNNFPHYLLVDASGHVVSAPALSPRPDNDYETIENSFIGIERYYRLMKQQH
jgi:hypothetical protein